MPAVGKRKSQILRWLALSGAVLAAFATYAVRAKPGDSPEWLVSWVIAKRADISALLLGATFLNLFGEYLREFFESRHSAKPAMEKIVNDLSKDYFPDGSAKRNRITLFKVSRGWSIVFWSLLRLPIGEKKYKWKALARIKLRGEYLGAYVRPDGTKNKISVAAFRISDDTDECEGVAGMIWDSGGQFVRLDLPQIDRKDVKEVKRLEDLPNDHPIADYARQTNSSLLLLKSCTQLSRHYYGTLIRQSSGAPWGVLLVDSSEPIFPHLADGAIDERFMSRFNDHARIIGMLAS